MQRQKEKAEKRKRKLNSHGVCVCVFRNNVRNYYIFYDHADLKIGTRSLCILGGPESVSNIIVSRLRKWCGKCLLTLSLTLCIIFCLSFSKSRWHFDWWDRWDAQICRRFHCYNIFFWVVNSFDPSELCLKLVHTSQKKCVQGGYYESENLVKIASYVIVR